MQHISPQLHVANRTHFRTATNIQEHYRTYILQLVLQFKNWQQHTGNVQNDREESNLNIESPRKASKILTSDSSDDSSEDDKFMHSASYTSWDRQEAERVEQNKHLMEWYIGKLMVTIVTCIWSFSC